LDNNFGTYGKGNISPEPHVEKRKEKEKKKKKKKKECKILRRQAKRDYEIGSSI
jgi:hypothetical protein